MILFLATPARHAAFATMTVVVLASLVGSPLKKEVTTAPERPPLPQSELPNKPQSAQHSKGSQVRTLIPVDIIRIIDGDTVEVRAQVWLDQTVVTRVRLRGIDAPELRAGCAEEAAKAAASRDRLATLTSQGRLYLTSLGRDKYGGRVVGDLIAHDGTSLAQAMLSSGHAKIYTGGKRQTWC